MSAALRLGAVALVIGSWPAAAGGQTSRSNPTDVQGWFGTALTLDLPKRWEVDLQYRMRLVNDVRDVRGSFYTGEVKYGLFKGVTLIGGYRLADVDDGTYHRFSGGAELSRSFAGSEIGVRSMLQYQRQNFADDEQSSDTDTYLRTRLSLKHALAKRLDAYASTEPYFKVGDSGYLVDNWRNTLGLKYEYAKGKKVDLFYIYRPDYARSYNRTFHVIGMNLDFKAKPWGSKNDSKGKKKSARARGDA